MNKKEPIIQDLEEDTEPETPEEEKKSTKRLLIATGAIVFAFILFIAAFRIVLYLKGPTGNVITLDEMHRLNLKGKLKEDSYIYNGFSFVYFNGGWYTQIKRGNTIYDIPLHYGPKDVENISVIGKLDPAFGSGRIIYITFDPTDYYTGLAAIELSLNLGKGLEVGTKAACDDDYGVGACKEREIVTCDDDADKSVINIKQANETRITLNKKCVIIEGRDKELLRATDNVILHFYGIMN